MESLKKYLIESVKHAETLNGYDIKIERKKAKWFPCNEFSSSTKFDWLNGKNSRDVIKDIQNDLMKTEFKEFTWENAITKQIKDGNWKEERAVKILSRWDGVKYETIEDSFEDWSKTLDTSLHVLSYKKNDSKTEDPLDVKLDINMFAHEGEVAVVTIENVFKKLYGIDVNANVYYYSPLGALEVLNDLNPSAELKEVRVEIYMSADDARKLAA